MPKHYQPVGVGMTPSKTALGRFLRDYRIGLGLTQVQVAELSGVMSQSLYSGFETGRNKYLNAGQFNALLKVLNCDPPALNAVAPLKLGIKPTTELAELIFSKMKKLELTPKQLAEKVGITRDYARILATKSRGIHYKQVKPLSEALELEPARLLNFAGITRKKPANELGRFIRSRRRERCFSTVDLANMLGVSPQFINQIELGQCRLSNSEIIIEKLAEILKIDAVKLRSLKGKRKLKQKAVNTNTVGGLVTVERLKRGLTQARLAQRVNIKSSTTVHLIEKGAYKGTSRCGRETLERIFEFFGCRMPY